MTYQQRLDRVNPGLVVLLVDQSESMSEPLAGGQVTKATVVTEHLNSLLYELILRCVKTPREPPRPYIHVAVITYWASPDGETLIGEPLKHLRARPASTSAMTTAELATATLRVDRRSGATVGTSINTPSWIEALAQGGTPMCAALNRAGAMAASWVNDHPSGFPPVIVNLSDGEATDGDPRIWADRIRSLKTNDGNVLLFNVNLSEQPETPLLFPGRTTRLPNEYAQRLWEMSSELPDPMVDAAIQHGVSVQPGARGFAFNADVRALATFLNIGTQIGRSVR